MKINYSSGTWVDGEDACSDYGQFRRKFRAIYNNIGFPVTGRADIPDTFFSIPATTDIEHGFLTNNEGVLTFIPHDNQSEQTPAEYRKAVKQSRK